MNILLVGATGAMGKAVIQVVEETEHRIVGGVSRDLSGYSIPLAANIESFSDEQLDVIIDFSSPELTEEVLNFACAREVPLVLATTGQTEEQVNRIRQASQTIAILDTHNTSIGVTVMAQVAQQLSKILYPLGYDIELIEKHHRYKKDAPSGTAQLLVESVKEGITQASADQIQLVEGRSGLSDGRPHNEIGVHAIRSGEIVGEHTLLLANNQETLELTHRASSKALFARGAITGASYLLEQPAGLYTMEDVLGLNQAL